MADPTSNIQKWAALGWDEKSTALWELAALITDLGRTNPDYASFAPEVSPFYGPTSSVVGNRRLTSVDPDDIVLYVDAWITKAWNEGKAFTAQNAYDAMLAAGFDTTRSRVVANTMWRLDGSGKLPDVIKAPRGWASSTGMSVTDASAAVERIIDRGVKASEGALSAGATILEYLPWIALGVGALVLWPYIAGARSAATTFRKVSL